MSEGALCISDVHKGSIHDGTAGTMASGHSDDGLHRRRDRGLRGMGSIGVIGGMGGRGSLGGGGGGGAGGRGARERGCKQIKMLKIKKNKGSEPFFEIDSCIFLNIQVFSNFNRGSLST